MEVALGFVALIFGIIVVVWRQRFIQQVAESSTMFAGNKEEAFLRQQRLARIFVPVIGLAIAVTGAGVILTAWL